jgi:large subunit ribosomal protein L29
MGVPQFNDILSLSALEISKAIIETENELFNLRFKKATRQSFKSHEIKHKKRRLAQLKTLLPLRIKTQEFLTAILILMFNVENIEQKN